MITLGNLQKTFGNQHILQGVTHTFETRSKTVILGSNGSGKSTLIKILSGAQEATENPPQYNFEGKNTSICRGRKNLCNCRALCGSKSYVQPKGDHCFPPENVWFHP